MSQHRHVLIAMSDPLGRSTLLSTLVARGLEPVLALNIEEAREVLRREAIAVVFCEDKLQDGGFHQMLEEDATRALRIPVIVCSQSFDQSVYIDAMTEGAFDFIAYPYAAVDVDWVLKCALPRAIAAGAA